MKYHPSWFAFFLLIIGGIALVLSSDNIFPIWMGFELSLLGFLPMFTSTFIVVEGLMKYFMLQAGGSAIFLAAFLWHSPLTSLLITLAMMLKLGAAPCYQWVPSVMASLSWPGCFLLTTIQKIPALSFLALTTASVIPTILLILLGALSVFIGGLKGFNQTYLRPLMGYSSIAQTGWLIAATSINTRLLILYFITYTYITYSLFQTLDHLHTNKVVSGTHSTKAWLLAALLMLTLAGFPPLSIFFLKSAIFISLVNFSTLAAPIIAFMIAGTTVSIYYYLTFIIPSLLVYWQESTPIPRNLTIHTILSTLMYPALLAM